MHRFVRSELSALLGSIPLFVGLILRTRYAFIMALAFNTTVLASS